MDGHTSGHGENSARLQGFSAAFGVTDMEKSIAYFCERMGFHKSQRPGLTPDQVLVGRDGVSIFLTRARYPFPKTHIYVMVDDVGRLFRELEALNCHHDGKPVEKISGMIEMSVRDLDGNRIIFAQELVQTRTADRPMDHPMAVAAD